MIAQRKEIRRVMLIFPPTRIARESLKFCQMPLGVAYLAASLRDRCEVRVLDATAEGYDQETDDINGFFRYGLPVAEILERVKAFGPDMVGVSCLFSPNYPVVEDIVEAVKGWNPDVVTVVGGNHPTWLYEECLDRPKGRHIDFIALNEGESTLRRLPGALAGREPLEAIDGLAWRGADGRIVHRPKVETIQDLDSMPFPARDLMPMDLYAKINVPHIVFSKARRNTSLFTGRGCPARCTFCSSTIFWGVQGRLRNRSVENVLDEMGECIARWGIREFHFEDDNFTADVPRAKALLRGIIERGYPIRWSAPNGVAIWTLDEELVALMKRSGVRELVLAFESGSQEVINKVIRKPLKLGNAVEKVALIKKHGIRHNAFFMIGLPGETMEQIRQTIDFIRALRLEAANLFAFFPLPGTPAYRTCLERGYIPADFDFTQNSSTRGRISTEHFRAEEITALVNRNWTLQYFRVLTRNPWVFLTRYGYLLLQPRFLKEISYRLWRRLSGKAARPVETAPAALPAPSRTA